MAKRAYTGNAPLVAQTGRLYIGGTVAEGTDIKATIGGKSLVASVSGKESIDAQGNRLPIDDAAAIQSLLNDLVAKWNASTMPEFAEITAELHEDDNEDPYALFIADDAGMPHEVAFTGPHPTIDVDTVQEGGPGQNEKQSLYFTPSPTGGNWTISWDPGGGAQTSNNIAHNAAAAAVTTALVDGMAALTSADVDVTGSGTQADPFIVEFQGAFANTNVNQITATTTGLTGGGVVTISTTQDGSVGAGSDHLHELLVHTSASYQIKVTEGGQEFSTVTLTGSSTAADVQAALRALPNVEAGGVSVYGGTRRPSSNGKAFYLHWTGGLAGQQVTLSLTGSSQPTLGTVTPGGLPAWYETYILETHEATAGTFTLSHGGTPTDALDFDAPPSGSVDSVDFQLEQLASLGFNGVSIRGDAGGSTYVIQFTGEHSFLNLSDLTADFAGITGTARLTKIQDGGKMGEGAIFQNDNFTDVNGTALTAHTSDSGHTWADGGNVGTTAFEIQSNQAQCVIDAAGDFARAYLSEITHSDVSASASVLVDYVHPETVPDAQGGIMFRWSDASNYWFAGLQRDDANPGGRLVLGKRAGGGSLQIVAQGLIDHTEATPYTIRVMASGAGISVWSDLDSLTWNDSHNQTAVRHGITAFGGVGDKIEIDSLSFKPLTSGGQNEIQQVYTNGTSGSFKLTRPGGGTTAGIAPNASAAAVDTALEAIYGAGNVAVSGAGAQADPWVVTFGGTLANQNVLQMLGDGSDLTGSVAAAINTTQQGSPPVGEQWAVRIHGATGGNFALSLRDKRTADVAFGATAAAVDAALEALAIAGAGTITVAGTGTPADPYLITTAGALAGGDHPQLVAHNEGLTGTGYPTIDHQTIVASRGPGHWADDSNWVDPDTDAIGKPQTGDDVFVEAGDETRCLKYDLDQAAVSLNSLAVFGNFTNGAVMGLPRWNANGYFEYRDTDLQIGLQGSARITIGNRGQGGSSLINLNTGASLTHLRILGTAAPLQGEFSAVQWQGTHVDNTVEILDGFFGASVYAGQPSNLKLLTERDGIVLLGKECTISNPGATAIDKTGGEILIDGATIEGQLVIEP